jgi:hypothetical protein
MVAVMLLVAVGVWVGPVVKPEPQVVVAALLTSGAAWYIAFRYWEACHRLGREHVAWIPEYKVNVFCADESARRRWSDDVKQRLVAALQFMERRTNSTHVHSLNLRLVSEPFAFRHLPGKNKGVYDGRGGIALWWPDGRPEPEPAVTHYEIARAVVARERGLYGDEAAQFIHREYLL